MLPETLHSRVNLTVEQINSVPGDKYFSTQERVMGEGKGGLVRDNLVMGEQLLSAGHKSKGTAF